ncbi:hypothetical protein [Streptomyces sp. NPDC045470]
MTPQERAAKDAADAVRKAEQARQKAEADLQRHGQARAGMGARR